MPYADAMNKTLVFAIFDFDRFSKHDQIGEVKVPLCQVDLAQTIEEWKELQSVEGEGGQVRELSRLFPPALITMSTYYRIATYIIFRHFIMEKVAGGSLEKIQDSFGVIVRSIVS